MECAGLTALSERSTCRALASEPQFPYLALEFSCLTPAQIRLSELPAIIELG